MPTPKELGVQVGDIIRNGATRAQERGPFRRVESVGKTTLHTSCGVTVSLNSPGWQMVRRQPRSPAVTPWNGHDAGPEQAILDVLGKTFRHSGGGLYHVHPGAVWDSGRNRWMIQYSRRQNLYAHLPEDFLRPGRFIEVNG